MPELIFTGSTARIYPETRDAQGVPLQQVEPGDVRDLSEPPDGDWIPAEGTGAGRKARAAAAGPESTPETTPEATTASDEAGQPGSKES